MKIIGKNSSDGFIVLANREELCQVMGFYSSYGMKEADKPDIGKEIKVSDLYQALSVSRERRDEISKLANQLRTVAGRVDSINQALASPIVEVEVKS
jgi:hypothetical protein